MLDESALKNTRLVYSTDPKEAQVCLKCKELRPECRCPKDSSLKEYNFVAKLRIEKAGRGGKTVTVIDELPKQEIFLRDLAKELKSKCGTGGTYSLEGKEGVIEIQGDKRDQVRAFFIKKNFKFKG